MADENLGEKLKRKIYVLKVSLLMMFQICFQHLGSPKYYLASKINRFSKNIDSQLNVNFK